MAREVLTAVLWLAFVSSAQAQEDRWADARPIIARAEALFSSQNYGAALTEFTAAERLLVDYPRHFEVLANIAACHERLFQYDLAVEFYRRYLTDGGTAVENRVAVEERVRSLERLLATLTIRSNAPADVWVDSRRAGRAPGVLRLAPGRHLVELRATLHEWARREVNLVAGSTQHLDFQLKELSQYRGLSSAYFWTFSGLAVAAVGVGSGFGIAALHADAQGNARARRDRYLNTVEDEGAVKRNAAVADVAFIGAAVLGASALVLYFMTDWQDSDPKRVKPVATVAPNGWLAGLSGPF